MNPQAPNWFTGGNPSYFNDSNNGTTTAAISQLSNSNFGQLGAQQAERTSGAAFQQQQDEIKSNPSFGRNAAVTSALIDRSAETYGNANANAVTKGAEVDAAAREKGAGLSMQQSQLNMQENELNYQRAQDASFGNSFLGHLTQDVVGSGLGALTGGLGAGLASSIFPDTKKKTTGGGDGGMDIADATFGKGEIKALIGKDGKTYIPRSDDGVNVGTKLGSSGNQFLAAGAVPAKPQFKAPMSIDYPTYKMGHAAFDFSGC